MPESPIQSPLACFRAIALVLIGPRNTDCASSAPSAAYVWSPQHTSKEAYSRGQHPLLHQHCHANRRSSLHGLMQLRSAEVIPLRRGEFGVLGRWETDGDCQNGLCLHVLHVLFLGREGRWLVMGLDGHWSSSERKIGQAHERKTWVICEFGLPVVG
jgi:hypothetical protein